MKPILKFAALVLLFAGVMVSAIIWTKITIVTIITLVVFYAAISLFLVSKFNKQARLEMMDMIGDRIWSIPAEIQCQHCRKPSEIDFTLDTPKFQCGHCNRSNKLIIQFITIAEHESPKL